MWLNVKPISHIPHVKTMTALNYLLLVSFCIRLRLATSAVITDDTIVLPGVVITNDTIVLPGVIITDDIIVLPGIVLPNLHTQLPSLGSKPNSERFGGIGFGFCKTPPTVPDFDPVRFLGAWYAQRQTPSSFQPSDQGCNSRDISERLPNPSGSSETC